MANLSSFWQNIKFHPQIVDGKICCFYFSFISIHQVDKYSLNLIPVNKEQRKITWVKVFVACSCASCSAISIVSLINRNLALVFLLCWRIILRQILVSGSSDRTVKFWDLETFELIGSTRPEVPVVPCSPLYKLIYRRDTSCSS